MERKVKKFSTKTKLILENEKNIEIFKKSNKNPQTAHPFAGTPIKQAISDILSKSNSDIILIFNGVEIFVSPGFHDANTLYKTFQETWEYRRLIAEQETVPENIYSFEERVELLEAALQEKNAEIENLKSKISEMEILFEDKIADLESSFQYKMENMISDLDYRIRDYVDRSIPSNY
jgi:predicted RNase H-like nuclease (RuvC/YqgF family)